MEISIFSKPRKVPMEEIHRVIRWAGKRLKIDQYKNPIYIEFIFVRNLFEKQGAKGISCWEDDNYRPREFSIEIDSMMSRDDTISTIIHEMVHVQQFAKGRMQDLLKCYSKKKWCGSIIDTSEMEYKSYPWEIEAYDLEWRYFEEYNEFIELSTKEETNENTKN